MFFSRVWLDPQRRGARRLLASPQRIHAVVAKATNAIAPSARPLWRLDTTSGGLQLFVVSESEPDFTDMLRQIEVPVEDGWQTTNYGPFLEGIEHGQRWRFRLAANPVRSVRDVTNLGSLPRGKRVPVIGSANLQEWLVTRAPKFGARVTADSFIVGARRGDDFRKYDSDGAGKVRRVSITAVQFDGTLEVTDPNALRSALTTGIGSAKAYGCGLLTLASLS